MALQKQPLNINFSQGVQTKSDPWQLPAGTFLELVNTQFDEVGALTKRDGFAPLLTLSDATATALTTYSDALIAIGTSVLSISQDSNLATNKGTFKNVSLSTMPVVRIAESCQTCDVAIEPNGLACATYVNLVTGLGYYSVFDSETGQSTVSKVALPATATRTRVFVLGRYFIVTFLATVGGSAHLQYVAVPISNPTSPLAAADISTQPSSISAAYDGYVANNNLYVALNGSDGGGAIRIRYLTSTLALSSAVVLATKVATRVSVTADTTGSTPVIWITFHDSSSVTGFTTAYSPSLVQILAPTATTASIVISGLTSAAANGVNTIVYSTQQNYSYASIRSDFTSKKTCTIAGVVSSATVILRSVAVASKAVYRPDDSTIYLLVGYSGSLQPTNFLIDTSGNIIAKLAYANSVGTPLTGTLTSINLNGALMQAGYLYKAALTPVNKSQNGVTGVQATTASPFYSQLGVNLATFELNATQTVPTEIGGSLHLTSGYLWQYDGIKPVEHGFHVYPEDVKVTTSASGGTLAAHTYYYIATYEWTDNAGNLHRSAPSIPVGVTTTGSTSLNTINIPYLRLTAKTGGNGVRIVVYRWSDAVQIYYQISSVAAPTLNDPTADSVTITDTAATSTIIGNTVLYTTGGVIENIAAPACSSAALFKSRLFVIDAEDPNLLWYSKQVIESTPVEFSDLFTIYTAPTTSSQQSTGPTRCIAAMDDKLILFKANAIYYITGIGPDNTGSNNDFTDAVFITSSVGCINQQSIILTPNGLMFKSNKGIWLLGRDLSTSYIGAPVEAFNSLLIKSAVNVPGTNQVRFTLDNNVVLMYDYYVGQWGTFDNIPAISSTIYQGAHTYLNEFGQIYQQVKGHYLDGSRPVTISFTTSWINMAGLQGFQRAYHFYLLGKYFSPHKLVAKIAYDYNESVEQTTTITPDNYSPAYGGDPTWGAGSPYGGGTNVEQWRVFLDKGKCESIRLSVQEVYDSTVGPTAGAGLSLSGINMILGIKKGGYTTNPNRSAG